jgi:hypothetical protein
MRPGPFAPVVGLDIDGTSGDYHGHFTKFIEQWTGRPMPDPSQYTGGVPFHKHLGVSRSTYNDAKLAYRQGGMKRSMPAYPGIGDFTRAVRKAGCQVWICTTRPYLRLDNIDPDTRHWLRRNGLQHDAVLYGEHKWRDLARAVGVERVVCVYDDLPAMTGQAEGIGLTAWLRTQPYNTYSGTPKRVGSVVDMQVAFNLSYLKWKSNHADS